MVKNINNLDVVADFRSKTPRFVVFATGQWDGHIMDWRGCNFRRVKVAAPGPFKTPAEANAWVVKIEAAKSAIDKAGKNFYNELTVDGIKVGVYEFRADKGHTWFSIKGEGTHVSDNNDIFEFREDAAKRFLGEYGVPESWEKLREEYREVKVGANYVF